MAALLALAATCVVFVDETEAVQVATQYFLAPPVAGRIPANPPAWCNGDAARTLTRHAAP